MALNHLRAEGYHGIGFPGSSRPQGGARSGANQNVPQTNAEIRGAGQAISKALGTLTGKTGEIQGRTSDAAVATVAVNNSRTIKSMPPQDTTINVHQVAQAQTNVGEALTASSRNVTAGTHSFEIEANGTTHTFNINVSDSDNNATIQRRMAAAINDADIGITASVRTGTENGATTTTLTVAAARTGTDSEFTIRDAAGSGLVKAMGVNGLTDESREARNAMYTVNGGEVRTSQSNEVNIAAGANVTLTGAGEAQITFGRSSEQAMTAARDLVNAVNSAIRGTNPNDGRGSARFLNDLISMNTNFSPSLSRVGIQVQGNGQLAINETRLQAAIEDGSFDRMSGLINRMERISSNAANTRHYANAPPPVNVRTNNFDFGNTNNSWMMMDLFM